MAKTEITPRAMGYRNPGATPNLRGVERNTARGVKEPIVLKDITELTYAPCNNKTQVVGYKPPGDA